jgi:uncharacterized membrane protein
MFKLKKISLVVLTLFYLIAGINHFRDAQSYFKIIPHYIYHPDVLNLLAGSCEILFAVMLIFSKTRQLALRGIILMLLAFLPVHISMISKAPLQLGIITVTPLLAWIRLLILQPLLILWALWHVKYHRSGLKANH